MTFERFCEIWDEAFPEALEETKNAAYSQLDEDVGSSEHLCKALLEAHAKGESLALTDWAGDYAIFDVNEMAKLQRENAELKAEIRETWNAAREVGGELQAFRIIERMVDRLGYGRTENNPPLLPQRQ